MLELMLSLLVKPIPPLEGTLKAVPFVAGETRRSGAVMFSADGYLYYGLGVASGTPKNDMFRFDGDSWTKLTTNTITPRYNPIYADANGKLYMGGGKNNSGTLSDFWCFDPTTNTWTALADCPITLSSGTGIYYKNKLYFTGFLTYTNTINNFVYTYDIETNTWATANNFPLSIRDGSLFIFKDKLYRIGGLSSSVNNRGIYVYDDETDTWSVVINQILIGDGEAHVAIRHGVIYVFANISNAVELYTLDLGKNKLTSVSTIITSSKLTHGFSFKLHKDIIYIAGHANVGIMASII